MKQTDAGNVESVEAGIDWITWVVPSAERGGWLEGLGRRLVGEQVARGAIVRPVGFQGYWGEGAESCAYGFRSDSGYLRLSGQVASSHWSELLSCSGHPTRLDVQTTIVLKESDTRLGTRVIKTRKAAASALHHRPVKRALHRDSAGLWIGTAGTRTSPKYIRVYDKGVEERSAPPGKKWRIELEAKQHLARSLFAEIRKCEDCSTWSTECCQRAIQSVAGSWPLSSRSGLVSLPPAPERELPSIARTRAWMETSVAPAVERLVIALGTSEVLRILGLDGYAEAFNREDISCR